MIDPILKKAMDKRDEALREVERWEEWIKAYVELSELTQEAIDIQKERAEIKISAPESVVIASTLRNPAPAPAISNGKATWPRSANGGL